ncbi:MAG: M23 family metallopeptidase [Ruminococcaceae bacterium]|nr:M23 family metallopeptidase [Oscillospiraceae bacterium]
MKKTPRKHDIAPKERTSIWRKWKQDIKDWIWYNQEHPERFEFDLQGAVYNIFIAPVRNLFKHLKQLGQDRKDAKLPESESRIGQLLLFGWGSLPRLGCIIRERLDLRRRKSIVSDSKRRSFFEHLQIRPATFLVGALGIAGVAVLLSLYTLGTSAKYDGVDLGTVNSKDTVESVVARVESVTREALDDANYTVDPQLLETSTRVVLRTDVEDAAALEENLSNQIGLVDYGYAIFVNDELIAATTFPGALEELLDQLKVGYHTPDTLECGFVEDVQIRECFVDSSYMMNLGHIAEILNDTKEGAVTYTVKSGDTLYGIAGKHDITVSELRSLNPGYSSKGLHPGDVLTISNAVPYLTVLNVERQNYVQDIPYVIEYEDDDSMYQGDYKVLSKGVYGKADITANVTYINGEEADRQIVASATLSEPIAELQARGTKPRPSWFPTGSFRWPCSGVITSYFGYRNTGIAGASTYHRAIDIANKRGTPIYAADGGTVVLSGWYGSLGYCVIIDHGNGFRTTYGHNSALHVSAGDKVYKGQKIASMGSTGTSSGNHCHFGVQKNGTWVNPLNYLP